MKLFLLVLTLFLFSGCSDKSQKSHQGTTQSPTISSQLDSFHVTGANWEKPFSYKIGEHDTVSPGTDGFRGAYLQLITKEDTIQFDYTSNPYNQHHVINIVSPNGKTVCILRFNQHFEDFTEDYILSNTGKVQFEVPEAFELANVIWMLSHSGERATNIRKEGPYYEEVKKYFKPYLDHPIFKKLNFPDTNYYESYYSFRENSICFSFEGDELKYSGPYFHVYGNPDQFGGLFKDLHELVEDFARKSNFRHFYNSHLSYYEQLIQQQKNLIPVHKMWTWIENEFPPRISSYKVIFSPLIGASHSTQNFSFMGTREDWFSEAVMFTSGPENVMQDSSLSFDQKQGLLSGIVFTEIDHNYVNPISRRFKNEIEEVFGKRDIWTKSGGDTDNYQTGEAVFNEYMTHALYCLYVKDHYDKETADFIIKSRERLMIDRRHYIKFDLFNSKLSQLYNDRSEDEKVPDLFVKIIEWAKNVN